MNENAEEFRKITMKVLVIAAGQRDHHGPCGLWRRRNRCGTGWRYRERRTAEALPPRSFWCWWRRSSSCPLRAFGSAFHVAMNGSARGEWLTLLEEPEPAWGTSTACGGRLELEDVHFFLCTGAGDAARRIRRIFPERGMTAIGESGCGKTTVAASWTAAPRPAGSRRSKAWTGSVLRALAHVSCETFLFRHHTRQLPAC